MALGYKKPLNLNDLPPLTYEDDTFHISSSFERQMRFEIKINK